MKIVRSFCHGVSVEVELTANELYDAFREQQHQFDLQELESYIEADYTTEEREAIAVEARRQVDHYDITFEFAVSEAVKELGLSREDYDSVE